MSKKGCFNYINHYDTANQPVYHRQCFCGTTACMEVESYTSPTNLFECEPEPHQDILDAISKINYGEVLKPINL